MSATAGKDRSWLEIAGAFLKLGAMGYGGAALMGLLQRELQAGAWGGILAGLCFICPRS